MEKKERKKRQVFVDVPREILMKVVGEGESIPISSAWYREVGSMRLLNDTINKGFVAPVPTEGQVEFTREKLSPSDDEQIQKDRRTKERKGNTKPLY